MRILLTGASSFTGSWFAAGLARAGHDVTATFRGTAESYRDIRSVRVQDLRKVVKPAWETEFGSEKFLTLAQAERWDLFCHHAAEMENYRNWDFDALTAAAKNTHNVRAALGRLAQSGCGKVVVTGSIFEPYEGRGDDERRAFSPYGLSKHFSFEIFRLEAHPFGLTLGKFVIPNPFGPKEDMRFTSYLADEWSRGRIPTVRTPDYVRDNIHVSLLALAYQDFCGSLASDGRFAKCSPSGYIETQGEFARRLAREIGKRLGRDLSVDLAVQTDFSEPMRRVNLQPARDLTPDWSEEAAWDELCDYYRMHFLERTPAALVNS
jgi:UDP-glucose 4-epimerase